MNVYTPNCVVHCDKLLIFIGVTYAQCTRKSIKLIYKYPFIMLYIYMPTQMCKKLSLRAVKKRMGVITMCDSKWSKYEKAVHSANTLMLLTIAIIPK